MRYFEPFPTIDYNNQQVKNILARVRLLDQAKIDNTIYHPFTINEGEKASKIAYDYYGSVDYVWLIYIVNGIVDPYYDWPLSNDEFDAYIVSKYGSVSAAQANILYYQQNPTQYWVSINNPTLFYPAATYVGDTSGFTLVSQNTNPIKMSSYSYTANPDSSFFAVDAYTDELNKNEAKRNILLLDRIYASTMDDQLKALLSS